METEICILGAGFAGIGAGYAAKSKGKHAIIFEKDAQWGGLCGNFSVGGFRFDKAIHMSFTENELCKDLFFDISHYTHPPKAYNYTQEGHWTPHPVQNNLRCLPVEERVKIIIDFFARPDAEIAENMDYKAWLRHQFGCYFSEHYPEQYTRKYWATEAEKLSLSWIGNRIYRPSDEEVLAGAFPDAPEPENVYYGKVMRYPKAGGYKQFLSHTAENLDIRCNKNVCSIDAKRREVHFSDGETCHYETLVSTLPLPIVTLMISKDEDVLRASEKLHTTSMALVSVGLRRKVEFLAIWFYVYDAEILRYLKSERIFWLEPDTAKLKEIIKLGYVPFASGIDRKIKLLGRDSNDE